VSAGRLGGLFGGALPVLLLRVLASGSDSLRFSPFSFVRFLLSFLPEPSSRPSFFPLCLFDSFPFVFMISFVTSANGPLHALACPYY